MHVLSFGKQFQPFGLGLLVFALGTSATCGQSAERTENGAVVHSKLGVVRVEACSDRVIHIVEGLRSAPTKPVVPVVIRPCRGAKFVTTSDSARAILQTNALKVEIDEETGSVRFLTVGGQHVLDEQPRNVRSISNADGGGSGFGVNQEFLLSPDEALYGLGQHQEGFFDLRGIPVRLLQANTNIAIPFLISTNGYGLLWNNPSLTDFDPAIEDIHLDENGTGVFRTGLEGDYGFLLSGNYQQKLRLSVGDQQIIDLRNMWLPLSAGAKIHLAADTSYRIFAETGGDTKLSVRSPSDTMAFRSQMGDAVNYYFFYGPEPAQVVSEYRDFTGAVPLLPRWAYGFWQCRERYSSQQQILDTATKFRNRKIPVDVLVQDWQYWGKYGWNAIRFDERAYPDPARMMSALHRQNLHMVISVWAKFGAKTAVNREMESAHLLLASAAGTGDPGKAKESENWADLFNPTTQKAFWSAIDSNLFRLGLDGWWLDASEPEGDPLKDDQTFLGPGTTVRNAFPLFETSAVYQGQRATTEDKRVVILSRSAYAGQQRTGSIAWSGDISANWETLRRQIPAGLSFGMSGFPYWTTDIGGFFRPADQYTSPEYHELLIRWFQFGAFCPIFRIHGYQSETEMWKYGPEVERILRQYDGLRYRLLPYIYSSAWGVTHHGETLMRGLPFAYPQDKSVRQISDEFLFGDALLIGPVTEPHASTRGVVLPAGDDWVDFWTGRTYRGGQAITADAPLDKMPILVKEGSIVPMGPAIQFASEPEDPLEIRIYAGKDANFELYEDSGDSYAYERGAKTLIRFHWDDGRNTLLIGSRSGMFQGMRVKRTFRIVVVRPGHGVGVEAVSRADRSIAYAGDLVNVKLAEAK